MPLFYLDVSDGKGFSRDTYGLVLDDAEAARKEATGLLPEIARDVLPDGDRRDFTVDVRDQAGTLVYTATLSLIGRWLKGLDSQPAAGLAEAVDSGATLHNPPY